MAAQVAGGELIVHPKIKILAAIFGAEGQLQLVTGPGALDRDAAVGGGAHHEFAGGPLLEARDLDVVQRRLRGGRGREDVVGRAADVTGGADQVAVGVFDDVQRVGDVAQRQVVQELFGVDRPREQAIGVVLPVAGDVALGADHDAVVGMAKVVVAAAAFHVAAKDGERGGAGGGDAGGGAEGGDFLRRQHRVVTGDVEGLAEDAAGRRLAGAQVVHEHDL